MLDPDVEMVKEKAEMQSMTIINPETGEEITQETPVSYDLNYRRVKGKNQVCMSHPPEEVLISRFAETYTVLLMLHTA